MKRTLIIAILLVPSLLGYILPHLVNASEQIQLAQAQCAKRMGPYQSQQAAERDAQTYRNRGYNTSNVWGEGGVVSQWSNRRYFFNVHLC